MINCPQGHLYGFRGAWRTPLRVTVARKVYRGSISPAPCAQVTHPSQAPNDGNALSSRPFMHNNMHLQGRIQGGIVLQATLGSLVSCQTEFFPYGSQWELSQI